MAVDRNDGNTKYGAAKGHVPGYPISGDYIERGRVEDASYSDKATRAVDNPLVLWIRAMRAWDYNTLSIKRM